MYTFMLCTYMCIDDCRIAWTPNSKQHVKKTKAKASEGNIVGCGTNIKEQQKQIDAENVFKL